MADLQAGIIHKLSSIGTSPLGSSQEINYLPKVQIGDSMGLKKVPAGLRVKTSGEETSVVGRNDELPFGDAEFPAPPVDKVHQGVQVLPVRVFDR